MYRNLMDNHEFQKNIPVKWWAKVLRGFVPFWSLVTPSETVDPVVEIGLPESTLRKDTSMISAYYLSFYE